MKNSDRIAALELEIARLYASIHADAAQLEEIKGRSRYSCWVSELRRALRLSRGIVATLQEELDGIEGSP